MRVTSKGQVTIPKSVREKLGIEPGDDVGFREEGPAIIVERRPRPPDDGFEKWLADFRAEHVLQDTAELTTDDIMDEFRGYSEDENDPGFKRDH
jgi:AbrB family looped-hinge helix DNA binding protein